VDKIVVFDFDKTLTLKDTNLGFYLFAGKKQSFFIIKLIIYFGLMLFRKLRLISNSRLKNFGLYLFLRDKDEKSILTISENYSKCIKMNTIVKDMLQVHKKDNDRVIISTASLSSYVRPIFPEIEVVGSELDFTSMHIKLKTHCYKQKKVEYLNSIGIKKIDIFYTDSLSDLPMVMIAKKIILVKKNEIIAFNSVNDFKAAFS
jgi:HAD superfamily phosphoserine phosphatase-like hydrolase